VACAAALVGITACAQTARGVVEDTKENASAVRGAVETVDVKTAIIADKTIDSGAIDVDTYQDKKVVVIRGSVPTQAQKDKAGMIARDNAKGYTVDNQLAVVPK
jgi:osmotically-inducible protein OsmY